MARVAAAILVVTILALTLWPLPEQAYRSSLSPVTCLVCGDQGIQDVLQNILMVLPLGMALVLAGLRPWQATIACFLLSFSIETLQYTVVPGRDASLSDVVTNTAGGWLGALLAPHLWTLLLPEPGVARRLALGAATAWVATWALGAWVAGGDAGNGHWRGRFPGDLPDAPTFKGSPITAAIDGSPLVLAPSSLPPVVEERFARDTFELSGAIVLERPAAPRENIVTIIDVEPGSETNNLVMLLNRAGRKGIIGFRLNASRLMLRAPAFNFGPVFEQLGSQVNFRIRREGGRLRGEFMNGERSLTVDFRIGPELLWAALAPRTPQATAAWRVESFLWAAALLGIAGYWAGRARRRWVVPFVGLLAITAQVIIPRMFAVATQSMLGWTLILAGLAGGALVARLTFNRSTT